MQTIAFLEKMSNASGVSGYETELAEMVTAAFKPFCDSVTADRFGNVVAFKKGGGKCKVLFAAHMDEIGLMVSVIEKSGFLRFVQVGGYDQRTLIGQEVLIHGTEDVFGVIGMKPPHLTPPDERKKAVEMKEMVIDTGFSFEEISKRVSVGSIITLKRELVHLADGCFAGKALDDRAGIAAMYECMCRLKDTRLDADMYYVATAQEEVGLRGAIVAGYNVMPDVAIAIDVGFAKTPELKDHETCRFGKGPAISIGPNMHPGVNNLLKAGAKKHNIPYQVQVVPDMSATDAVYLQVSGAGVATSLLSIPLKYMHTPVETMCLDDIVATGRLLAGFAAGLNDEDLEAALCL